MAYAQSRANLSAIVTQSFSQSREFLTLHRINFHRRYEKLLNYSNGGTQIRSKINISIYILPEIWRSYIARTTVQLVHNTSKVLSRRPHLYRSIGLEAPMSLKENCKSDVQQFQGLEDCTLYKMSFNFVAYLITKLTSFEITPRIPKKIPESANFHSRATKHCSQRFPCSTSEQHRACTIC